MSQALLLNKQRTSTLPYYTIYCWSETVNCRREYQVMNASNRALKPDLAARKAKPTRPPDLILSKVRSSMPPRNTIEKPATKVTSELNNQRFIS